MRVPPFIYVFTYTVQQLFGQHFNLVIVILNLLFNICAFFIIYKIIEKETKKTILLVPAILYGFLIFTSTFDAFEMTLGSLLLLLGVYTLFYSEYKYKEILSGIFFILSIFTYQAFMLIIGVAIAFYTIKTLNFIEFKEKLKPKINFNKNIFYSLLKIFLSAVFIILIFYIMFPNFVNYAFLLHLKLALFYETHTAEAGLGYLGQTSIGPFLSSGRLFVLIALFIPSLYMFIRKRDILSSCLLFSFAPALYVGILGADDYKLIVFLPFFIMSFVIWMYGSEHSTFKKVFFIFLIIAFIYPGMKATYLTSEFNDLAKEVGYGLHYLPQQNKSILLDINRLPWYDYDLDYNYDQLAEVGKSDIGMARMEEKMGLVNLTEWQERERVRKYIPIIKNTNEDKYSLFIVGPQGEQSDVRKIIQEEEKKGTPLCSLISTTLEDGHPMDVFYTSLLFKDIEQCNQLAQSIFKYYNEHFESICKKDELVAKGMIRSTLYANNVKGFNKECDSKADLFYRYADRKKIKLNDMLIMLAIGCFASAFYILIKDPGKRKFIKYLIAVLIIVLITLAFISQNKDTPYRVDIEGRYFDYAQINTVLYGGKACLFLARDANSMIQSYKPIRMLCDTKEDCVYLGKLGGYSEAELNLLECIPFSSKPVSIDLFETKYNFSGIS